jgi:hypothetical protein
MSQDMRTVPVDVQVAEHAMRAEADAIAEYLRALSYEMMRLRDNPTALRLRLEMAGLAEKFAPELERHYQAHQRLQQVEAYLEARADAAEDNPLAPAGGPGAPPMKPRTSGGLAVDRSLASNNPLVLTDYDRRGAER